MRSHRALLAAAGILIGAYHSHATSALMAADAPARNLVPHGPYDGWQSRVRNAGGTGLRLRGGAQEANENSQSTHDMDVKLPVEVGGLCYGPKCKAPERSGLFPLPRWSLLRPTVRELTAVAAEQPEVIDVPNRGTTAQACLFKGRRLNPAAFPEGVFINERRALLTGRFDFRTDEPNTLSGIVKDDGEKFYRRGVVAMKRLEFLNLDWCNRARYKDHMVIASRVFGVWTTMTNKIIRETSEETRQYARTTLTLAMTKHHILAGEEQLAIHWDKKTDSVAFEVCSFSWPLHPVAAIAQPILHDTQKRAAIDFCERMFGAVRERRFRLDKETGKVYEATLCDDF
eukprot:Tamp_16600.p1 GENE.Tamp_16600~~Tamp_16600.p1  ORF type:complete len:343 (+),score=46.75 Tamp_16600:98-1126(+)